MNSLNPKVSIIGCGNVGVRYAYALMIKGIARQIVMVDIDKDRLEGEVQDLSHGAPYVSPVNLIAGDYSEIHNSHIVVITAGKSRKQNDSRLDLVKANVNLYKEIIPKIVKYAPNAIYLIVTNPVDILAYVAYKIANELSNKPANEVISSGTVLDTARFRYLIAKHCNVDPRNVHAYILGEHGDSEFAVWSRVMIGGILFKDYCPTCNSRSNCNSNKVLQKILSEVRDSGHTIVTKKGETSYGIGLALVRITEAILHDENAVLPVSCLVNGYLGINDVYLSLPSIVNKKGVHSVLHITLNNQEKELLQNSAKILKSVLAELQF
ncbi:MAG: L-lactate dehydrogenase [Candidatus Hodarchaeota archaeon]